MSEPKRLTKSSTDKVIFGICGGIAKYFNTDPVIVRVAYVIITLLTAIAPAVLAYIILAVIIPEEGSV